MLPQCHPVDKQYKSGPAHVMVNVQKLLSHVYKNTRHHFNLQSASVWARCEVASDNELIINVVSAYRNPIVTLHWMYVNDEVMQMSRWLNSQGISFIVSCLKVAINIVQFIYSSCIDVFIHFACCFSPYTFTFLAKPHTPEFRAK